MRTRVRRANAPRVCMRALVLMSMIELCVRECMRVCEYGLACARWYLPLASYLTSVHATTAFISTYLHVTINSVSIVILRH